MDDLSSSEPLSLRRTPAFKGDDVLVPSAFVALGRYLGNAEPEPATGGLARSVADLVIVAAGFSSSLKPSSSADCLGRVAIADVLRRCTVESGEPLRLVVEGRSPKEGLGAIGLTLERLALLPWLS